jgi:hypothetical protein
MEVDAAATDKRLNDDFKRLTGVDCVHRWCGIGIGLFGLLMKLHAE